MCVFGREGERERERERERREREGEREREREPFACYGVRSAGDVVVPEKKS